MNGITDPVRFEFLRAAAASNRRLWSRYRFRISLRSAASTKCVSALAASHFRGREVARTEDSPALRELEQEPTARELEVLQLVADGLVNREIGQRLFLSEETVKSHVRHLLAKLQARSRAHAVAVGFRRGLIN